jgi:hypothetical protein
MNNQQAPAVEKSTEADAVLDAAVVVFNDDDAPPPPRRWRHFTTSDGQVGFEPIEG